LYNKKEKRRETPITNRADTNVIVDEKKHTEREKDIIAPL